MRHFGKGQLTNVIVHGCNDSRVTQSGRTTWSHLVLSLKPPLRGTNKNPKEASLRNKGMQHTMDFLAFYSPTVLKILACCLLGVALSAIISPVGAPICARCSNTSRLTRQLPQLIHATISLFSTLATTLIALQIAMNNAVGQRVEI